MRVLICVLLMGFAFSAGAQERPDPREAAAKEFAKDLASLQAKLHKGAAGMNMAQGSFSQAQYASYAEDLYEETIEGARVLVGKWKTNPYVEVEGFSVAISLTGPELSVSFHLK